MMCQSMFALNAWIVGSVDVNSSLIKYVAVADEIHSREWIFASMIIARLPYNFWVYLFITTQFHLHVCNHTDPLEIENDLIGRPSWDVPTVLIFVIVEKRTCISSSHALISASVPYESQSMKAVAFLLLMAASSSSISLLGNKHDWFDFFFRFKHILVSLTIDNY